MDHYERSKLGDAIKEEKYKQNDFIIKEVTQYINIIRVKTVTYFTLSWMVKLLQPRP